MIWVKEIMFDKAFNPCYISLQFLETCNDEADNLYSKQLVVEFRGGVHQSLSFPMKQRKAVENPFRAPRLFLPCSRYKKAVIIEGLFFISQTKGVLINVLPRL